MGYIINESLSKDDNLERAKAYGDKAQELLNQFDTLLGQINKDFPVSTFGLSRTKEAKLKSPNEVYNRLKTDALTYIRVKNMYEVRERKELEKQKEKKIEEDVRQIQQSEKEMLNEAIAFCIANGKIFGKDFTVDTAIYEANDIALWKEVDRRETEIGDDYIKFNGQNCDNKCDGWNPQHHRCQCGNTRVKWERAFQVDFRDMEIYAEAY
jgi:hypothetical protein